MKGPMSTAEKPENLSKREHIASLALTGILSNSVVTQFGFECSKPEKLAEEAIKYTDALLTALKKSDPISNLDLEKNTFVRLRVNRLTRLPMSVCALLDMLTQMLISQDSESANSSNGSLTKFQALQLIQQLLTNEPKRAGLEEELGY